MVPGSTRIGLTVRLQRTSQCSISWHWPPPLSFYAFSWAVAGLRPMSDSREIFCDGPRDSSSFLTECCTSHASFYLFSALASRVGSTSFVPSFSACLS